MNVLVAVGSQYPDKDEVVARLKKGAQTDHITWVRKGDRATTLLAKKAEVDVMYYTSTYDWKDEALLNELLNEMDFVIVYHDKKSAGTGFFVSKARKWPYNRIFGHKVEINEKDPKKD